MLLHPEPFLDGSIHEILAELPNVCWQPEGFWAILGYQEALEVLNRHDVFSSAFGTGPISEMDSSFQPGRYDPAQPAYHSLNLCDPPAHSALRQHLDEWIAAHPLRLDPGLFEPLAQGGDITETILRGLPRQTLKAMLEVNEELAAYLQDIGLRPHQEAPPGPFFI